MECDQSLGDRGVHHHPWEEAEELECLERTGKGDKGKIEAHQAQQKERRCKKRGCKMLTLSLMLTASSSFDFI